MDEQEKGFYDDCNDFWKVNVVPRCDIASLSSILFLKNYVMMNKPVIITNALIDFPIMQKISNDPYEYFLSKELDKDCTINYSPFGNADSIIDADTNNPKFVLPYEKKTSFYDFLNDIMKQNDKNDKNSDNGDDDNVRSDWVPYLSAQNDSLRHEFKELNGDVPLQPQGLLKPVFDALGNIEAINLWIGDARSTTATHKDFFENIYCVLHGQKHFTLFPPCDVGYLYEKKYPVYRYEPNIATTTVTATTIDDSDENTVNDYNSCENIVFNGDGKNKNGKIELIAKPVLQETNNNNTDYNSSNTDTNNDDDNDNDNNKQKERESGGEHQYTSWVSIDAASPAGVDLKKYPLYEHARPVHVTVNKGEVLYIPSQWYHSVKQSPSPEQLSNPLVVAVNYWHEMEFGVTHCAANVARRFAGLSTF